MIGDRNPMRIAGQVVQNMLRSAKRPLGINDPLFAKQRAHKDIEVPVSGDRRAGAEELKALFSGKDLGVRPQIWPGIPGSELSPEERSFAANASSVDGLARVHRPARHNGYADEVVRFPSRCCSTLKNPINAPRRLGVAATSSSVAVLASKGSANNVRLFCQISGTSRCGTLKTT